MEKIYLISGMGADERIFMYLNFTKYEKCTIKWLAPLKNESLTDYCKRLLPQIDSPNPIIAGLSFGGIVTNEISKLIPVRQVILISSVRSWREIPWYYRLAGKLKLHKIVPWGISPRSAVIMKRMFHLKEKEHLKLLIDMSKDCSPAFMAWIANVVVKWKGEPIPGAKQIHGTRDTVFPFRYIKYPDKVLEGGSHVMLIQKAKEVSRFIDGV
jgi:hypothetical protein